MLRSVGLLALLAGLGYCAEPTRFDVASVKRMNLEYPRRGGLKREITPTSVSFHTATFGNLFEWAYGMTIYQVIGPNWLNWPTDAAYDIDAKTGSPATEEQLKQMMQTLMVERFQLRFHRDTGHRDLRVSRREGRAQTAPLRHDWRAFDASGWRREHTVPASLHGPVRLLPGTAVSAEARSR